MTGFENSQLPHMHIIEKHFSPSHVSYIAVYIKKQFRHVLLQKVGPAAFAVACLCGLLDNHECLDGL